MTRCEHVNSEGEWCPNPAIWQVRPVFELCRTVRWSEKRVCSDCLLLVLHEHQYNIVIDETAGPDYF